MCLRTYFIGLYVNQIEKKNFFMFYYYCNNSIALTLIITDL